MRTVTTHHPEMHMFVFIACAIYRTPLRKRHEVGVRCGGRESIFMWPFAISKKLILILVVVVPLS